MATTKETIAHILDTLNDGGRERVCTARAMFGEYGLYYNGVVVGFVCDDTLFVKIVHASSALETICEKGPCYPGSKDYYVVEESDVGRIDGLVSILHDIAQSAPKKKLKSAKKAPSKRKLS